MEVTKGRRTVGALMAVGATTSALAMDVPVADADANDCVDGHICVWDDDSWQGGRSDIQGITRDANWSATGGVSAAREDHVSSHANNSSKTWAVFWEHDNFNGFNLCTAPGSSSGDLSNFTANFTFHPEDRISSHILTSDPETLEETETAYGPRCDWKDQN